MFKFRKKNKNKKNIPNIFEIGSVLFYPIFSKMKQKSRYDARKRLLNRWGRHSPKKIWYCYLTIAAILVSFNILGLITHSTNKSDIYTQNTVPRVDFASSSFKIMANKQEIRDAAENYVNKTSVLMNEFDSLMKKDVKSHEDSLRIISIYKSLNNKTQ